MHTHGCALVLVVLVAGACDEVKPISVDVKQNLTQTHLHHNTDKISSKVYAMY